MKVSVSFYHVEIIYILMHEFFLNSFLPVFFGAMVNSQESADRFRISSKISWLK